VRPRNGRFEIRDGHRRFIASQRAGHKTIAAIISDRQGLEGEAIKIHANRFREDVNPAEEAAYFDYLLREYCEGDVDRLCSATHQRRGYVEERLLLLRADPQVLAAIRDRQVSLAVARELNLVRDQGNRALWLDAAIKGGATARVVREWRLREQLAVDAIPPPPTSGENQYTSLPAPVTTLVCFCCESGEDPWELELLYAHRRCRKLFLDAFLERLRAPVSEGSRGEAA
jgi:ParB/RepB/Spo0J family partition protein